MRTSEASSKDAHRPLRIMQISASDIGGGAEKIAWSLHNTYRDMGHEAYMIVGEKFSDDPNVLTINANEDKKGLKRMFRAWQWLMGWQSLAHFESTNVLRTLIGNLDIIHAHNLHGGYFNLAALYQASRKLPVVLTLHDHWLLTGHCAHPFDCTRWLTGCGNCPDLSVYPQVRRDGTSFNWKYKRYIINRTRPHIVTPSHWLMNRVDQGFLRNNPKSIIKNGVDTDIFSAGSQADARHRLGLKMDQDIVLFVANMGTNSPWKDKRVLMEAFNLLADRIQNAKKPPLLLVLGQKNKPHLTDFSRDILFRPFTSNVNEIADYYRAADILAYPTRADNCPLVILEAMACGLPIVASAIGGIPELISNGHTGLTVEPSNTDLFSRALHRLLENVQLRKDVSSAGQLIAKEEFNIKKMARTYLDLYGELLRVPPEINERQNMIHSETNGMVNSLQTSDTTKQG